MREVTTARRAIHRQCAPSPPLSERLNLTKPLDAWFGDFAVQLVEVSAHGASMLHDDELPAGSRALLRFAWRGEEIELTTEITRTEGMRSLLQFIDESPRLGELVRHSAEELHRAREANASGDRERNLIGDATLTAASERGQGIRSYLVYEFAGGKWSCRVALLPDQPENGFTVSAAEPHEQIDLLQRTFEAGDEQSRAMTRAIAELSIKR